MSEAGHERNQRITYQRWTDATKHIARGKNGNTRGKTVRGVPLEGSDTRTVKSGDQEFTIGSYRMTDKPSLDTPEVFHMNVIRAADEIVHTVIKKQNDYGPNNIRRSPFGPIQGLAVRLYDKVARLANLSTGKKPSNESLRDTFVDIAGYGIIGLMILDETFPKEQ